VTSRSEVASEKDVTVTYKELPRGNRVADVAANAATTQGGLVDDANKRLADAYAGLFRAFLKRRNSVTMVTFWGVNDGVSWRARGRPLLFDANDEPKPAFDAVIAEGQKTGNSK
jgi:endo-1,4-beta-xylanase